MGSTTSPNFYLNSLSSNGLVIISSNIRGGGPRIITDMRHDHTTLIKRKYASSTWGGNLQVNNGVNLNNDATRDHGCAMFHHSSIRRRRISSLFKPIEMMMIDENKARPNIVVTDLGLGRMVNHFVFQRNFDIKTYEIGADRKASIETLLNLLQETAINHVKAIGLLGDGLGLTPEMCKKNLIWVMAKLQVVIDRYPMCGDIVEIDTWKSAHGKIGMCSNWMLRDSKTGDILTRASCVWLMMNTETRKLSKFPDEVRAELDQYFMVSLPIVKLDSREWSKGGEYTVVDHVCNGLAPTWSDLDINQHVHNTKYIGWIIQSVPKNIVENYELASMALEYCRECNKDSVLRECNKDSVLRSHTSVIGTTNHGLPVDGDHVDCQHVLQLETGGGAEIMKGKTRWRLKHGKTEHTG